MKQPTEYRCQHEIRPSFKCRRLLFKVMPNDEPPVGTIQVKCKGCNTLYLIDLDTGETATVESRLDN